MCRMSYDELCRDWIEGGGGMPGPRAPNPRPGLWILTFLSRPTISIQCETFKLARGSETIGPPPPRIPPASSRNLT